MSKKIKIAMITNHFGITGIGTVIINYCKALDKSKYDLTIIAGIPIAEQYVKDAKKNDIKIIALPSRHHEPQKHYVRLYKTLRKGKYDIVHDHGNSSMMAIELALAKLAGIKVRIAHCHSKVENKKLAYKILMPIFKYNYTKGFACSKLAGNWLFGEGNFEVLINGFDTKSFKFDNKKREKIRKQLNVEGCFVIGHVGRFNEIKNQLFLLEVFEKIASTKANAILLLVGIGPNFAKIQERIFSHPNKNRIILYGESTEIASLYSAMDVFVFPSKVEGLGLAAVEAQISGLPCVVSDVVPKEIIVGPNVDFISLKKPVPVWANAIVNKLETKETREEFYNSNLPLIMKYDMNCCVEILDKSYQQMIEAL